MSVAENLAVVRDRIAAACARAGRDPGSVRLVAVSKTQPLELLREALAAGQTALGENYAQELREKSAALADAAVEWHFLGALQTNKARLVAGTAALIHTCDRLALAQELSKRASKLGAVQRVLVEVNTGREPQKAGALPEDVPALVAAISALPSLECAGLMCIPPADADPRPHFRALRELRDRLGLRELSMGMSADYEAAIEEGATLVRVGTAIFGERRNRPH
jgi:pyridoxal phosphate enzyme (YggS family)